MIVTDPADSIQEGSPVTFDGSTSSDPEGDSLKYVWDLGDGVSATGPLATRSYYQLGSHGVTLIVTDRQGESDTATTRVLVVNALPVITRIEGPGGPIAVDKPTAVRVTANDPGSGDVLTMQIDWKDGTTFTGGYHQDQPELSIAHTYSALGTYAVEVSVRDNDSGVTKRVIDQPIVVVAKDGPSGNRTPTAKITKRIPPGPIPEGTVIAYDALSSSDPDGDSLSYLWNWGVGSARTSWSNVAQYYDEDSYEVILIVTDPHGASDTAEIDETVVNVPPAVASVVTPAGAVLVGTSSEIRFQVRDAGAKDTVTAQVDWKDGTVSTATLTPHSYDNGFNASAAHTYAAPGTYAVEITARDNDGGVTTLTVDHPINAAGPHANHPPVAHITGPASGSEGAWLHFSGASSTDPDGDSLKVRCHAKDGKNPPSYPGYPDQSCTLAFPDNGTYVVSAIVTDDAGAADTATTTVTVTNVAPKLEWQFIPAHAAAGFRASLQVLVNDPGSADQNTVTVDWGDGTGRTSVVAESSLYVPQDFDGDHALGATLFHAYQNTGAYTITVTDQDDDGGASNSITTSPPVIVFNANQRQTVAGYEAMDLGTLGGTSARPADLNDRGQIVGTSLTDRWALHGFLWDQGEMRDLGTTGEHASEAIRINESGVIAGTMWNRLHGTLDDNCISTASGAIWQGAVATSLRGQGFCHNTYDAYFWLAGVKHPRLVRAMNSAGDIAMIGYGKFDISSRLWRNGWQQMQLPSPWYPFYPTAMNDRGQVVGTAHQGEGSPLYHAFIWQNGAGRDLGVLFGPRPCTLPGYGAEPDCSRAAAQDVNESGQVVGISTDSAGQYHFVLWADDKIEDLGLAEWSRTASGPGPHIVINDHGDIAASVGGKAFFLRGGVKTEIPSSDTLDIVQLNENGEVVGNILMTGRQHIFVWSPSRGMTDLGSGPDGFDAAWVVDINARGDILGYTAPCTLNYYNPTHCFDYAVDYWATQVRAILWRKD